MSQLPAEIFKAYDIRGIVNKSLTADVVRQIGHALGSLAVEQGLLVRVPERYRVDAHHWLILHGRYVCQARRPLCEQSTVRDCCDHGRTHHAA